MKYKHKINVTRWSGNVTLARSYLFLFLLFNLRLSTKCFESSPGKRFSNEIGVKFCLHARKSIVISRKNNLQGSDFGKLKIFPSLESDWIILSENWTVSRENQFDCFCVFSRWRNLRACVTLRKKTLKSLSRLRVSL